MAIQRVSTKGQVVIPVEIRRELGITPGMYVNIRQVDAKVEITPVGEDLIRATRGMFRKHGDKPLTQELLEERRREKELEEARYARLFGREPDRGSGSNEE
jgi:AbrB family looped-hinge helix DNA binding protein